MTDKESILVFVLVFCAGLFVLSWAIRKMVDFYARERIYRLKRALESLDQQGNTATATGTSWSKLSERQ